MKIKVTEIMNPEWRTGDGWKLAQIKAVVDGVEKEYVTYDVLKEDAEYEGTVIERGNPPHRFKAITSTTSSGGGSSTGTRRGTMTKEMFDKKQDAIQKQNILNNAVTLVANLIEVAKPHEEQGVVDYMTEDGDVYLDFGGARMGVNALLGKYIKIFEKYYHGTDPGS